MVTKTSELLRSMKQQNMKVQPIGTEIILPNHSGLLGSQDASNQLNNTFLKLDCSNDPLTGALSTNETISLLDSKSLLFGTGQDSGIYYDGTHMYFNSRLVGSGDFKFINGNIYLGANTTNTTFTKYGNTAGDEFYIGTNGAGRFQRSSSNSECFRCQVSGDSQGRWIGTSSGIVRWGSGAAASDAYLYRSTTSTLKIDSNGSGGAAGLIVTGQILAGDKVAFTQTDGNEYIDSLNDGYIDIDATTGIRLKQDTTLDSNKNLYLSGDSAKVDAPFYYASGTAPVSNGTYTFDGTTGGTVSSITVQGGIITGITTR